MSLNQASKVELSGKVASMASQQHYRVNTNNILDDTNNIVAAASNEGSGAALRVQGSSKQPSGVRVTSKGARGQKF